MGHVGRGRHVRGGGVQGAPVPSALAPHGARHAWKLLRLRSDGTLGSLFIHRQAVLPVGPWLVAHPYPTKGYAFRPGWHALLKPVAPHLSKKGRVWCEVDMIGWTEHVRPEAQGGRWLLAKKMRITKVHHEGVGDAKGVTGAVRRAKVVQHKKNGGHREHVGHGRFRQ